jgi:hypothetical protein
MRQSFRGETNGGFKLFGGIGEDEQAGVRLGREPAGVLDRVRNGAAGAAGAMYCSRHSGSDRLTTGPLPGKPRGNSQAACNSSTP